MAMVVFMSIMHGFASDGLGLGPTLQRRRCVADSDVELLCVGMILLEAFPQGLASMLENGGHGVVVDEGEEVAASEKDDTEP